MDENLQKQMRAAFRQGLKTLGERFTYGPTGNITAYGVFTNIVEPTSFEIGGYDGSVYTTLTVDAEEFPNGLPIDQIICAKGKQFRVNGNGASNAISVDVQLVTYNG